MRPTTQARRVDVGIEGSSVLETAERTSGYGDSSSSVKADGSKFGSSYSSISTWSCCVVPDRTCQAVILYKPGGKRINKINLLTSGPPRGCVLCLSNSMDLFSSSPSEWEADMAD